MARKRSPENDYICIRCGCPCDRWGDKHIGGGQGMRACRGGPRARLRSEHEADVAEWVQAALGPRLSRKGD